MQRVVRFSLVGLLTIAGLTACGDKVTVPPPVTTVPATPVVHNVTVSPASASINFLGSFQFAASVDADAGISSKAVTWKTGDATIATVDATGKATALSKAGTVSIIATSVADATVAGAAVLTVSAAGGGGVVTVSISTINATVCIPGGGCA
jgi:alpha-L-fucosidase 2